MLGAGCDGFVRKPFRERKILEMLNEHLGVRLVYEERGNVKNGKQRGSEKEAPVPEALAVLPGELLETLKQGARRADFILLTNVIEKIHEHDAALADALARLAEDFEYNKILELIQELK